MKQKKGILAFILSAVVLFILSRLPLPSFMAFTFGTGIMTILIVALVLGLINLIVVSLARSLFKRGSALFMFIIALLIDALALWLTARFVSAFSIDFFPNAIIIGFILALVCSAAGLVKD